MGAEGKHHARGEQRADELLERHGAEPEGADLHVGLALTGAPDAAQAWHDLLLEHRTQFQRRAGQHRQRGATAMEEDPGGGAPRVGQALAAFGHGALGEVGGGDLPADEGEAFTEGGLGLRHMAQTDPEGRGDGLARVVVGSRADAARGHDQIVGAPPFADGAGDFRGIVADHEGTADRQAPTSQVLPEPEEVAVLAQAVQQFVPDVDDEDLTGGGFAGFHLRGGGVAAGLGASA